ncbi:MAG: hypothetical protein QNJ30_03335 [Kiloniellales bacterium]|nr:hypothetical protein [Kiloniellales bacterium]
MREDMFKMIVERPRRGVRRAHRVKSRLDPLPERTKVGMKRSAFEQKGRMKWLNENLAPLRRYLRKQRGRPWDKVYSEICARLDTRSTVKQHVRDHLQDLIVVKAMVAKDGALLELGHWGDPRPLHASRCELYVDPRDGIIKEVAALRRKLGLPISRRARRRRPGSKRNDVIPLAEFEDLKRIDGIWYRLRYLPLAGTLRPECGCRRCRPLPIDTRPLAEKRQLSKAELRRRGLSNQVAV